MDQPKKIAIIGVGLIGGSLSLSFKKRWPEIEIIGYHDDINRLDQALKLKVIDEATDNIEHLCKGADFIFICAQVSKIVPLLEKARPFIDDDTVITDVGSTKSNIVEEADKIFSKGAEFIGGHPLAGSEQKGVLAASATLFKNAVYVLTPTAKTSPSSYQKLHGLLTQIGATVIALSPDKHDQVVAVISHLPHLLASSLVNLAAKSASDPENILFFAAGGFRDMTRIAAGDPELWLEISLENKKAILESLNGYMKVLEKLKVNLEEEDSSSLQDDLLQAKELRQSLSVSKPTDVTLREIKIPVTDSPGVISRITLAFGKHGINIEDIQIVHTGEESGIVKLLVNESGKLDDALLEMEREGFNFLKTKEGFG